MPGLHPREGDQSSLFSSHSTVSEGKRRLLGDLPQPWLGRQPAALGKDLCCRMGLRSRPGGVFGLWSTLGLFSP